VIQNKFRFQCRRQLIPHFQPFILRCIWKSIPSQQVLISDYPLPIWDFLDTACIYGWVHYLRKSHATITIALINHCLRNYIDFLWNNESVPMVLNGWWWPKCHFLDNHNGTACQGQVATHPYHKVLHNNKRSTDLDIIIRYVTWKYAANWCSDKAARSIHENKLMYIWQHHSLHSCDSQDEPSQEWTLDIHHILHDNSFGAYIQCGRVTIAKHYKTTEVIEGRIVGMNNFVSSSHH